MMILTSNPNKKGNKNNKIIAALIVGIIAVSILIAVIIGNFVKNDTEETTTVPTTEIEETIGDVVIDDDITENTDTSETTTEKGVEIIKLEEPETTKPTTQKPTQQTTVKPAEPVTQGNPAGVSQGNNHEIIDSGSDSVKEYSCGKKGHHCDSKETHDFIVSLESKGCPHCGSHSCKSFYTYDEWGNACYDPTKCESYNAKSDPCEYCQECGKKVGTGSGSTCVRFTVDTKCPECGKSVKGKTCHSH
ncbi:MAG: hypothetical protein J6V06_07575 [Clostridia bacterium]|jgi:hypothetical protein|nr:hypothetical protein [Clostridia bacterium]